MNMYFTYFDTFSIFQIFGILTHFHSMNLGQICQFQVRVAKSVGFQPYMPYIGYECHILIRYPGPVILVGVGP